MSKEQNELLKYIKKESFQKIKLLSGKSIGIKKWNIDEEKDFLFAVETQMENTDLVIDKCLELARKCVDNQELFDSLSRNDIIYLMSKQRAISKGEEVTFAFRCNNEECTDWKKFPDHVLAGLGENDEKGEGQTPLEDIIHVGHDVDIRQFDYEPVEVDGFKFFPKEIPWELQRKFEAEFVGGDELHLNKLNWEFVVNSIAAIEVEEDNKIEVEDVSLVKEFVGQLGSKEFTELSNGMGERLSKFAINKKVSCPVCEKENNVVYDELFSLMVF